MYNIKKILNLRVKAAETARKVQMIMSDSDKGKDTGRKKIINIIHSVFHENHPEIIQNTNQ